MQCSSAAEVAALRGFGRVALKVLEQMVNPYAYGDTVPCQGLDVRAGPSAC